MTSGDYSKGFNAARAFVAKDGFDDLDEIDRIYVRLWVAIASRHEGDFAGWNTQVENLKKSVSRSNRRLLDLLLTTYVEHGFRVVETSGHAHSNISVDTNASGNSEDRSQS